MARRRSQLLAELHPPEACPLRGQDDFWRVFVLQTMNVRMIAMKNTLWALCTAIPINALR